MDNSTNSEDLESSESLMDNINQRLKKISEIASKFYIIKEENCACGKTIKIKNLNKHYKSKYHQKYTLTLERDITGGYTKNKN